MIYELVFGGSWVQTCMVGLLTAMLVYWIIQKRKYKLPPGPFALPLIGHYLQLDNKFMHEKIFKEWTKKYGPVVTLRVGPIKTVFVNSLETAMEVLVQKSTDFAGRSSSPSTFCTDIHKGVLRNIYRKVDILTNDSVRDAVVGQVLHYLKSAEGPFSHDVCHMISETNSLIQP